jgi:diguanylate cyclase (GGDEF)-like protein
MRQATNSPRDSLIRSLFESYIEMYASRDKALLARFSADFSGYTGGGDFLVKDLAAWQDITLHDFAQVPGRIRIEMLDLSLQDLSEDVVLVCAFFHIHLPLADQILSRETARAVLVFRQEAGDWKIVHSGISIPYHLVGDDEVYPLKGLLEHNRELEALVEARTRALEEANHKLETLSYCDGLTGIANRRSFDRMLQQEWNRGLRAGTPLALIMMDVDHFKHFNDHYGHQLGDACLQALAKTLATQAVRAGELVARYGGEEFVVLLPNSDEAAALAMSRKIQRDVHALGLQHEGADPAIVTLSLGVASLLPSKRCAADELLRLADAALYCAKQAGRNCVCASSARLV